MRKEKLLIEWSSANIFKNIETERMVFADSEGILSPEENLRIQALNIKAKWMNQSEVDLWLNVKKHAENLSDLPKIMREVELEESLDAEEFS